MLSSFARLNPQPKRSNIGYFNSKLVCKQCTVQYSVTLKNNLVENCNESLIFQVKRINEHQHNEVIQIRGDNRKKIANIVSDCFSLNLQIKN